KVGLVNPEQILAKSDAGQAAMAQMKAFKDKQTSSLKKERQALQKKAATLQKNASIQSDAAQKAAQEKFQKRAMSFRKKAQKAQNAFRKKRQELLQPLKAKLHDVVQSYATSHGFDVIINERMVIYHKDGLDLTKPILKAFNAAESK